MSGFLDSWKAVSKRWLEGSISLDKESGGKLHIQDERTKGQLHVTMHCEVRKPPHCLPLPGQNGFRLETGILPALPLPKDLHTLFLWILLVGNYITLPVQTLLCIEHSAAAVLKQGCRRFSCTHEGSPLFPHLLVHRTCDAYPSWRTSEADSAPKYPFVLVFLVFSSFLFFSFFFLQNPTAFSFQSLRN